MNWSNEWKPKLRDIGAESGMPAIDQSATPVKLSIIANEGEYPRQIEAIQVGDLAVHDHINCPAKAGAWQVTHVPTVTRFNAVPFGVHSKADLIEWCKKVQSSNIEDWKELAGLTPDSYKSRFDAKDRIMNLCQNTVVGDG